MVFYIQENTEGIQIILRLEERLELYLKALDDAREQAFMSHAPEDIPELINLWEEQSFAKRQSFLNEYITLITVKDRSVKIDI